MKKPSMMIIAALTAAASVLADVTFDKDTTLAADADYSGQTVAVYGNATLDLAGHKLKAAAIAGAGAISSGGAYVPVGMATTPADLTGCIQLDYTPLCTDRIEAKVCFHGSINRYAWVFSARKNSSAQQFDFYATPSKWYAGYSGTSVEFSGWSMNTDYEIVLDGNLGVASVNGTEQTFTREEFTAGMPLVLFDNKASGSGWPAQSLTMYYLRAYGADGTLKVNLAPMKRVADGTIGLYDTVAGKFWTLTTGSFTAAEKLESVTTASDNTGHIDTGYVPSCTDRVETKVNFANYPTRSEAYYWLFSARTSYQHNDRFECELNANKYLYVDRGASSGGQVGIVPAEKDLELVFDAAVPSFSIDGEKKTISKEYGSEAFTMTKTLRVFDNTSDDGKRACKSTTMYYFRVYDSTGALKVDLVPVRRACDDTVGFCDFVRGGFYKLSAGTLEGGGAVATQTALTAPGGACSYTASNSKSMTSGTVANLFDDDFTYSTGSGGHRIYFNTIAALPVAFTYDFGEAKVVNAYSIWCGDVNRAPTKWTLEGSNDNSSWTELDSQSGQTTWTASAECRTKVFANANAYRYVRLNVSECNSTQYFDLTQLEYYNIPATARPGELHLASDSATANATVRLGGDLKLVKEGAGTFTASKAAQGYTGGTEIAAGTLAADAADALGLGGVSVADGATLRLASPLTVAGEFAMAEDANLDFYFAARSAAPTLTLAGGASVPSSLKIGISRGGDFSISPSGSMLTSGFDFGGVAPVFTRTDWLRKIDPDASGNLRAYGPAGFMIIFK